jgi:hypothetical protein
LSEATAEEGGVDGAVRRRAEGAARRRAAGADGTRRWGSRLVLGSSWPAMGEVCGSGVGGWWRWELPWCMDKEVGRKEKGEIKSKEGQK